MYGTSLNNHQPSPRQISVLGANQRCSQDGGGKRGKGTQAQALSIEKNPRVVARGCEAANCSEAMRSKEATPIQPGWDEANTGNPDPGIS